MITSLLTKRNRTSEAGDADDATLPQADATKQRKHQRTAKRSGSTAVPSRRVRLDDAIGSDVVVRRMPGHPRGHAVASKRRGWTPMGSLTTSRAAGALTLATAGAPTGYEGFLYGIDVLTNQPVIHDPFTAYNDKSLPDFTSPNVVFVGDVGSAKSSGCKTWGGTRPLLLGYRMIVVDKKLQENDTDRAGEYVPLARALGVEPITLRAGDPNSTKINILDRRIAGEGGTGSVGQQQLLEAVASLALGGPLSPEQVTALRVARESAVHEARDAQREATVVDVLRFLSHPDEKAAEKEPFVASWEELRRWGQLVGLALDNLVKNELSGIIDGPTSPNVQLNSSLTVFDVSGLDEDSAAIPVVMGLVNTWMRALIASEAESIPTIFLVEEGWHLANGEFGAVARRNAKIARGIALENITALQHLSDIPADSPARALIRETQTVFVYSQAKTDDAGECVDVMGWEPEAVEMIRNLPQGTALMQIGQAAPIMVRHMRSAWEETITNTDTAMASTNRQALDQVRAATHPEPQPTSTQENE